MRDRHPAEACYRLLFELAWREFFHRTWQIEGDEIFTDMRHPQERVQGVLPPQALLQGRTRISSVDASIGHLLQHGTLHNHARMWVASLACNLTHTHWHQPARWLHYHLLDGDLASNTLSWQWVAGTFSNKRYLFNQENVNRYSGTTQNDTWLDASYDKLQDFAAPEWMAERKAPDFEPMPTFMSIDDITLDEDMPIALHSLWNLDPMWHEEIETHIVFVDTEMVERWPLSPLRWALIEHWVHRCGARLAQGSVTGLNNRLSGHNVVRREYPGTESWPGNVEPRNWLYPMPEKSINSFSKYWKQVKGRVAC